ncbi:hypothetical protein LCM28_09985 [Salipiger pacificus]|nr:hypothetical protein [Alloyangia pacifica]
MRTDITAAELQALELMARQLLTINIIEALMPMVTHTDTTSVGALYGDTSEVQQIIDKHLHTKLTVTEDEREIIRAYARKVFQHMADNYGAVRCLEETVRDPVLLDQVIGTALDGFARNETVKTLRPSLKIVEDE